MLQLLDGLSSEAFFSLPFSELGIQKNRIKSAAYIFKIMVILTRKLFFKIFTLNIFKIITID